MTENRILVIAVDNKFASGKLRFFLFCIYIIFVTSAWLVYVLSDEGQYSDTKLETSSSTCKSINSTDRSPMPSNSHKFSTNPAATAGVGSLTIPEFSSGVRTCLLDGKSNEVWGNVINKLVTYYTRKYPDRLKT